MAARFAGAASRITRRDTRASIQGMVLLKLDPSASGKLFVGKRMALVCGTNDKTTTTHFGSGSL
jgi:lipid II isoglutaminyl synthase (glutamine-hydrolysing)